MYMYIVCVVYTLTSETYRYDCVYVYNYVYNTTIIISLWPVVRLNGKNYEALANALEGKTVAQCRNFFTNYKRKLNLPRLIAEYEIKHVSTETWESESMGV